MISGKDNILIYPYGRDIAPIVRHNKLLQHYKITGLISPKGWALAGNDAAIADGGTNTDFLVGDDYEAILESFDTLLIADCKLESCFKKKFINNVLNIISYGKNIINTMHISNEYSNQIKKLCKEKKVYYKTYDKIKEKNKNDTTLQHKHEDINTPVVFVGGILCNSCKYEIQLSLRENFLNEGYKISQIGSRHYCELLGFHSFPQFMINPGLTEKNKIIMFNNYVKDIEVSEKPDIIIIGIPGEILPYNKYFRESYGSTAFLVSQAVQPDFTLLSLLFRDFKPDYLHRLSTAVRNRLGINIDLFCMSNIEFNQLDSKELNKKCYNYLDMAFVEEEKEKYKDSGIPVYNIFNNNDINKVTMKLINCLSSQAVTII